MLHHNQASFVLMVLKSYTLRARYTACLAHTLIQNYPDFAVSLEVNKKLVQQVIIVFLLSYLSLCLFFMLVFFILQYFFLCIFFIIFTLRYLKYVRRTKVIKDDHDVSMGSNLLIRCGKCTLPSTQRYERQ